MIRTGILVLFSMATALQMQAQGISSVEKALKAGDAAAVSGFFAANIKYCYNDDVDFIPATEAKQRLEKFFARNKPTGYSRKHEGGKTGESKYIVGELGTSEGRYRIHIYFKPENGEVELEELRINRI